MKDTGLMREEGSVILIDKSVVLVSLHVSNDHGEGFIHVIDNDGNSREIIRILMGMNSRDIYFKQKQPFWKGAKLMVVKTNKKGELLVSARYSVDAKENRLVSYERWNK